MTERDVVLRLVRGVIDVHVIKGGTRRWLVEAGALSVEVVGTRFTVDRSPERVSVRVRQGSVLVRSGKLAERVEQVQAGQEISVPTASEARQVPTANRKPPVPAERPSVDALFARADRARLDGQLDVASQALARVLQQFPTDARVGLAAYQLAVIKEQQGQAAAEVARAFARALAQAEGASLRQDCHWRLVRVLGRAGSEQASRRAAERALAEYPNGRYADRLRAQLAASGAKDSKVRD